MKRMSPHTALREVACLPSNKIPSDFTQFPLPPPCLCTFTTACHCVFSAADCTERTARTARVLALATRVSGRLSVRGRGWTRRSASARRSRWMPCSTWCSSPWRRPRRAVERGRSVDGARTERGRSADGARRACETDGWVGGGSETRGAWEGGLVYMAG